jgi:4-hydroxybenzoate polyprenyltransferase
VNLSARELLSLSRPRFWMYLIGPYAVGLLIGARSPGDLWSWRALGFGLLFLFPANLFVYGVNDAHDFETDARNAKKQGYEARLQRSHQGRLLALCFGCCAPFVLLALLAAPARAWAPLGLFFVLAHQYSAPPVRAKARPFVDSLFNGLYVCPALFAYALLGARGVSWPWVGAAWCWTGAMHAYSAVPDIQADRQAGVPTVATALGLRSTLLGCAALYALSALLSLSALGWLSPLLGAVYLAMMALSLRAGATRGEAGVMEMYRFFPALNTLAGFLLFWRVAWIKFEPAILAALPALRPR